MFSALKIIINEFLLQANIFFSRRIHTFNHLQGAKHL